MDITTEMVVPEGEPPRTGFASLLRNRNFLLLWIGQGISLIGDQFYLVALPWLVLQLTGDSFALGMTLALAGIPRAMFMLVGGALTDRFTPRKLMMWSNYASAVLTVALAFMTITGQIELWMIYGFALAYGVVDAFFFPAQGAIVPQLVNEQDLQTGNTIIQGTAQLSLLGGPVAAGILLAVLGAADSESGANLSGIGTIFLLDAITFVVGALALSLMRVRKRKLEDDDESGNMLSSIRTGLKYAWENKSVRTMILVFASFDLLLAGPIFVGIPVLADTRLPEGAAAYGLIFSAYGGGSLLGTVLGGVLPPLSAKWLGRTIVTLFSFSSIAIGLLGVLNSTLVAVVMVGAIGITDGYAMLLFITWLQKRVPNLMHGRIMSLLMMASIGSQPISLLLSGILVDWNLTGLFLVTGSIATAICLWVALRPEIGQMGYEVESDAQPEIATAPIQ